MKRRKLLYTWELLDKLLNLKGGKIYQSTINDYGIMFDVYGGKMEHAEGANNCHETISTVGEY